MTKMNSKYKVVDSVKTQAHGDRMEVTWNARVNIKVSGKKIFHESGVVPLTGLDNASKVDCIAKARQTGIEAIEKWKRTAAGKEIYQPQPKEKSFLTLE